MWYPPTLSVDRPAYLGIADAIGDAVATGALAGGDRLPTIRDLATHLRITTATTLRGYAEARRRGLTTGTVGRGSFVRHAHDAGAAWRSQFASRGFVAPGVYNLRANVSPAPPEWSTPEGLSALLPPPRRLAAILGAAYTHADSTEPWEVREAGAAWAARCGLALGPERVLLAAGGQHALAAALCAIREADAPVAVPAITNSGVLTAALRLGIPVVPVRVDAQGLDIAHLERVCRSSHPSAVYCAPVAGNPVPTAMPEDRRVALVRVAERHKLWIIEDDAAGAIVRRTSPIMAARLPEQTLWLGSIAQSLGFGLRVAFVAVPLALESTMQEMLRALAWTGATPGSLLIARSFADGTLDRVMAGHRTAIAERHALVARILGRYQCVRMAGVPYVWLDPPTGWRTETLHAALQTAGVAVAPAAQFTAGGIRTRRGVRIGAGALLSVTQYADALHRIAEVCAHPGRYRV